MQIYTPTQARTNLFKLMVQTNQSHSPVYIVGKNSKSVLISEEDYRSMVETLYITSIPGMKESILNASKEPLKNFAEKIDWDNV
jgi:antitoxin YefM